MGTRFTVLTAIGFMCLAFIHGAFDTTRIRLVGSNDPKKGRVEVFLNGEWGTVCDDDFTQVDATVICRMGGYRDGVPTAAFGPGDNSMPINFDDLTCLGQEKDVFNCQRSQGPSNCKHEEDIGVNCTGDTDPTIPPITTTKIPIIQQPDNCKTNTKPLNVQLRGPKGQDGIGIVELMNSDGDWGTLCDDQLDTNIAKVVCRMLCFDADLALPGAPASGIRDVDLHYPISISNLKCKGTETDIFDCDHTAWGSHNCAASEFAMVTCNLYPSEDIKPPDPILDCGNNKMNVSFSTLRDKNLDKKHIKLTKEVEGSMGRCGARKYEIGDYITISIPYGECGFELKQNETHLIFSNSITYDYTITSGAIYKVNTYKILVSCELPRSQNMKDDVVPQSITVTKSAAGVFVVKLKFYRDNRFTQEVTPPVNIALGEFLYVDAELVNAVSNLKLVVRDCIATPTDNANDATKHQLFDKSCPKDTTVGFFPFNKTDFGFSFQTFKFRLEPNVYLHCNAFVCKEDEREGICERSCIKETEGTNRRKRSTKPQAHHVDLHTGPMHFYDPTHNGNPIVIERISDGVLVTEVFPRETTAKPSTTSSLPIASTPMTGDVPTPHGSFSITKIKEATTKIVPTSSTAKMPTGVMEKNESQEKDLNKLKEELERLKDRIESVKEKLSKQTDSELGMLVDDSEGSGASCNSVLAVKFLCMFWLVIGFTRSILNL